MILILTSEGDYTTDLIQNWLHYYKHPYIQITTEQIFETDFNINLSQNETSIVVSGDIIPINKIGSILYRKFGFFRNTDIYKKLIESKQIDEVRIAHMNAEFNKIIDAFISVFSNCSWLPNPQSCNLNKFIVLKEAVKCGLNIPESRIINNKISINDNYNWITKSIYNPIIANWGKENKSMMYTVPINVEDIKSIPHKFFPSLIQKRIEKDFEVRVFYLDGKFFPMGIFSQNDSQTREDFRNYNWDNPNRFIPISLPKELIYSTKELMKRLKLNTGSIDFIKEKNGDFIFLEVNPTGQFGMIDFPCNYGLHKKIAEWLINFDI